MNAKLLVIVAIVGLVAALVSVSYLTPQTGDDVASSAPATAVALTIELDSLSVLSADGRAAEFEIKFNATNPNPGTVLLQYVSYKIYTDDQRIHVGLIGQRPTGFVASSDFVTMIQGAAVKLDDKFYIRNDGSRPEFWESIVSGSAVWSVDAEVSYNHSSFVAGGENLETFEFRDVPLVRPGGALATG